MSHSEDQQRMIEHAAACGMDRRQILGTIGLAGLGWLASTATGQAAPPSMKTKGQPIVKVPTSAGNSQPIEYLPALDVPDEWAARNRSAHAYYRYLKSLRLYRVDAKQVVEAHARAKGNVWNSLPPQKWWRRMGYVLKVADRIAREMNISEVEIISAYRSPAYNARCRGARAGSWHKENVAVDLKFPTRRASQVTAVARELRNLGLFRGGVGGYWNFTHIDARGTNIDW